MEIEEGEDLEREIEVAGYVSMDHFEECRSNAWMGLIRFGNSFHQILGELLQKADLTNSKKIMRYWEQECTQHAMLYKIYMARELANGIERRQNKSETL